MQEKLFHAIVEMKEDEALAPAREELKGGKDPLASAVLTLDEIDSLAAEL